MKYEPQNTVDLGAVCVFDAAHLRVGEHLEIERGLVAVVESINEDGKVYLRAITGWELFEYRLKRCTRAVLIGVVVLFVLALLLLFRW
jgi:uncharacterized protein YkvS